MNTDRTFYEAALLGLENQQREIESRIHDIRVELAFAVREYRGKRARTRTRKATHRNPHRISAAGRKHIAEATRKRWAAYRKAKAKAAKKAPKHA